MNEEMQHGKALVETSKFKGSPNFGEATEGHILFRTISLRCHSGILNKEIK